MAENKQVQGSLIIIASAIIFGMMPLFTKSLYAYGCNPVSVAFLRFSAGSLFLYLILHFGFHQTISLSRIQFLHLVGLAFLYSIFVIMLYLSYNYIDSGLATTLHFTYPIFALLITVIFLKTPVTRVHLLCLLLCISGMALLYTPGGEANLLGILLAVGSGLLYAAYIILVRKSRAADLTALLLTFWLSLLSALISGLYLLLTRSPAFPTTMPGWAISLLLALVINGGALFLFQKGLEYCDGVMASLLSTFEPITSVLIGILLYQETFTLRSAMAIALILLSTLLLVISSSGQT